MLNIADPASVDECGDKINQLVTKYPQAECWGVIYQGDVRCRCENFERLRRHAQDDYEKDERCGFKPDRPWD
eukprot:2365466-Amphidinium_carterae.2